MSKSLQTPLSPGDICKKKDALTNNSQLFLVFDVQKNTKTALVVPLFTEETSGSRTVEINRQLYYARLSWPIKFQLIELVIVPKLELDDKDDLVPIRRYLRKKIEEAQSIKPQQPYISHNNLVQQQWERSKTDREDAIKNKVSLGSICTLSDSRRQRTLFFGAKYFIPVYRIPDKGVRVVAVMDNPCAGEVVIINGKKHWAIADIYYTISPDQLKVVPNMKLKSRDETIARLCSVQYHFAPKHPEDNGAPTPQIHTTTIRAREKLYVYKGLIVCFRRNHKITQITAIVKDQNGNENKIDIEYCLYCNRKMLSYSAYEYYKDVLGPLARDIKIIGSDLYNGDYDWNESSILRQLGYNVSQRDNLSAQERHSILIEAIQGNVMTKTEVLHYLERRMDINGMKIENDLAFKKWLDDYNFIHDYDLDTQPETYINSVEKY